MKYVVKAKDGSYKRERGDSLSSRYDDAGYTCWHLDHAVHYDSIESAGWALHEDGKFSVAEGAEVVPVQLIERAWDSLPMFHIKCDRKLDGEREYTLVLTRTNEKVELDLEILGAENHKYYSSDNDYSEEFAERFNRDTQGTLMRYFRDRAALGWRYHSPEKTRLHPETAPKKPSGRYRLATKGDRPMPQPFTQDEVNKLVQQLQTDVSAFCSLGYRESFDYEKYSGRLRKAADTLREVSAHLEHLGKFLGPYREWLSSEYFAGLEWYLGKRNSVPGTFFSWWHSIPANS